MDPEIPGYQIIRKVGHGGSSSVYLAVQKSINRRVALKVLHQTLTTAPDFDQRFLREGRIIGQLNHKNIIQIYDIGHYQQTYYMALEYLPGPEFKAQARRMTLGELVRHMIGLCEALAYSHSKGFIHRDIKADNVLFRDCLLYTSPSPRDAHESRMPSSA